ncbi:hypothetical protein B0O99DRAFT_9889 [Bisporella sp. PMI_857]|nr:hypothetical protein B0O99DRAFT_9889 [Bisporella sp. PMI_857]
MNRAIDNIQDGYKEYGTVFGPGLALRIFRSTKGNSPLRDLCIGGVIIHMDRGCSQLRDEVMKLCFMIPDYLPHMLKWIARNFHMFGKRERIGFTVGTYQREGDEVFKGFSMFNRAMLCPCHFHTHAPGQAHKGHKDCAVPFLDCDHPDGE